MAKKKEKKDPVVRRIDIKTNNKELTIEFLTPAFEIGPQSVLGKDLVVPGKYEVEHLDEKNEEHLKAVAYLVHAGIGDIGRIVEKSKGGK